MKDQMSHLERESLFLIANNLTACNTRTKYYTLSDAFTELRSCCWNKDCTPESIRSISIKLKDIERTLGATISCLDAVANSIENRQYAANNNNESQS